MIAPETEGDEADRATARSRFAWNVAAEVARLGLDVEGWEDYLGDAEATSVSDGIDGSCSARRFDDELRPPG